jgi:hypothetical protein
VLIDIRELDELQVTGRITNWIANSGPVEQEK